MFAQVRAVSPLARRAQQGVGTPARILRSDAPRWRSCMRQDSWEAVSVGGDRAGCFRLLGAGDAGLPVCRVCVPRTGQHQWAFGRRVLTSQAMPGDLVFLAGSDGTMTAQGT